VTTWGLKIFLDGDDDVDGGDEANTIFDDAVGMAEIRSRGDRGVRKRTKG